jgi:hypothetical protein
MAQNILQGYLAQEVYPSDYANIPYPVEVERGENTAQSTNKLIDTSVDFIALGVKEGDIVYNDSTSTAATVILVDNATSLTLNDNLFPGANQNYHIYKGNAVDGGYSKAANGCVLYIGTTGNLKVTTLSGTTVTFANVPVGFFPVQVYKVWQSGASGASDIIALWG